MRYAIRTLFPSVWILLLIPALAPPAARAEMPVSTYSIVARDEATGQLGVAVQSHWFQVGTVVSWARAGVGAVATQSFVNPAYGPRGLELMAAGESAPQALDRLLAEDPKKDVRQVAMVDGQGRVAVWTGPKCIAEAGHTTGEGYSVQANLMDKATVWGAMRRAFERAEGDLAERLLVALEAAEAEGGDIRGRQSAALLVVDGGRHGEPWQGRLVDLRVDDHPDPLAELRRLLELHRAYESMNLGDEALAEGETEEALKHYSRAARLAPDIEELPYWQAATLYESGRRAEALPIFRDVFARNPAWVEVTRRLPAAGLLPDDPELLAPILDQAPGRAPNPGAAAPAPAGDGDGGEMERGETITVTGRLTGEGVECPALRGDDGILYTLTGDLGGFEPGDRVRVQGSPVAISFCQQGTTLAVANIEGVEAE